MPAYGWDEPENDSDSELCPKCESEKDKGAECVVCRRKREDEDELA